METPLISIITINYNNLKGLQNTFSSVFDQTFKAEYIVIDGGSTDGSTQLIEENKNRFSYTVSEKDNGVYHAMNKGIRKATGKYLLFLNSGDNLINSNILEEISTELKDESIIYGNVLFIESPQKSWTGNYPDKLSFEHFVKESLPHPASFIKKELFDQVGYYDEQLKICSDWKFFIDAICKHQVSYKHISKTISVFYLNGLSSGNESARIIKEEKTSVLKSDYYYTLQVYEELNRFKLFYQNKAVRLMAKVLNKAGLINLPANNNV